MERVVLPLTASPPSYTRQLKIDTRVEDENTFIPTYQLKLFPKARRLTTYREVKKTNPIHSHVLKTTSILGTVEMKRYLSN